MTTPLPLYDLWIQVARLILQPSRSRWPQLVRQEGVHQLLLSLPPLLQPRPLQSTRLKKRSRRFTSTFSIGALAILLPHLCSSWLKADLSEAWRAALLESLAPVEAACWGSRCRSPTHRRILPSELSDLCSSYTPILLGR